MKTQYYAAASLDGFIATTAHSLDWLFQFGSVDQTSYPRFIAEVGAIAMGSHTYEWLLQHPEASQPWPYRQPVWVFSTRTLPRVPDATLHFVAGDVRPVHAAMARAAQGRNLWIVGGGELAGRFHDAGLLDELIVQVTPVLLGAGAPLLPRAIAQPPLQLVAMERYGAFAELRYALPRQQPISR